MSTNDTYEGLTLGETFSEGILYQGPKGGLRVLPPTSPLAKGGTKRTPQKMVAFLRKEKLTNTTGRLWYPKGILQKVGDNFIPRAVGAGEVFQVVRDTWTDKVTGEIRHGPLYVRVVDPTKAPSKPKTAAKKGRVF